MVWEEPSFMTKMSVYVIQGMKWMISQDSALLVMWGVTKRDIPLWIALLVISSSQIPPPLDHHQPPIHLVDVNLTPNISHWMDHLVWIVLSSLISLNLDLVIVMRDQPSMNLLHLVFVIQDITRTPNLNVLFVFPIPSNLRVEMIFVLLVMISSQILSLLQVDPPTLLIVIVMMDIMNLRMGVSV